MTTTAQVIFESRNGCKEVRDGWLDYCREQAPNFATATQWATIEAAELAKRIGCETRFRIENWRD